MADHLEEQPTNSGGHPQAYSSAAAAGGPVAGFDKFLFSVDDDLLTGGYQTPSETGQAKWRFSNIYPVMKLSLDKSSDGPSIVSMVHASKEYTQLMDKNTQQYVKKRFASFMEEAYNGDMKKCPSGQYYCTKRKKCMPIPKGYHIGYRGWLEQDDDSNGKKNGNGNGNGSHNGNGGSNGNGGGHSGGNGNGGGGGNGG